MSQTDRLVVVRPQQPQAALNEWDVEIGSVVEPCIHAAVLPQQGGGDQLLPYIGRVPDDEVESFGQRLQEEVAIHKPLSGKPGRFAILDPVRGEDMQNLSARLRKRTGVEFHGSNASIERRHLHSSPAR
ncbi:hypothetical protein [Hydrogenophaga sp.]|uniref:hypothetical protein n=1 Tax=Hydrogenophaga sp. TaxID=1904254 RepID=UPI00271AAC0E|nr:hypothetical protein [Hydrogenophaga sp.]MDO9131877.1 hypothetical protein [Hydrogenophaga sp.]